MDIQERKDTAIEDLQEAAIRAGGRMFRRKELLAMTFEEMLSQFLPNSIEFRFQYEPKDKVVANAGIPCENWNFDDGKDIDEL